MAITENIGRYAEAFEFLKLVKTINTNVT